MTVSNHSAPALACGEVEAKPALRRPMSDEEAVGLLEELVRTPSVSGQERAAAELLVRKARGAGLVAGIDEVGNFVAATHGDPLRGEAGDLVLLGHLDTVAGAIPVRREGDLLFGRGSVDAKGPLAAFVAAATRLPPLGGHRVVVIGAVEEETATSRGARAVIGRYSPAACIIGEPSGWDGVTIGYKGRLLAEYALRAAGGHSAGPHGSPADALVAWWGAVLADLPGLTPGESSAFRTVQATLRSVMTTSDGLYDRVEAVGGFRLPVSVDPATVEAVCLRHAAGASITFRGHERGVEADRSSLLVRSMTGAIRGAGARPRLVLKTGTSDMNVVAPPWRCPIAAYGPGDSALDHTPDEHISITEYVRAIGVLTDGIIRLARAPAEPSTTASPATR